MNNMHKKRVNSNSKDLIEKGLPPAPQPQIWVLGIDPGLDGAFALFNGRTLKTWDMPILKNGKSRDIDFGGVRRLLETIRKTFGDYHIYLERAVAFGMGTTSAFNYGRGFRALEIAIELHQDAGLTLVEPTKWTRSMHEGISKDMKAKAKSLVAVKRLYPKLVPVLPTNKNGAIYDGHIDAFLIAGYGYRQQWGAPKPRDDEDFF